MCSVATTSKPALYRVMQTINVLGRQEVHVWSICSLKRCLEFFGIYKMRVVSKPINHHEYDPSMILFFHRLSKFNNGL